MQLTMSDGSYRSLLASWKSMADAVSSKGKRYADLPKAFAYRKSVTSSCTCRSERSDQMSVTDDPTLRPGDIVVTSEGVRVFRGDRAVPHRTNEFVDYRKAGAVSGQQRAFLDIVDQFHRVQADVKTTQTSSTASASRAQASAPAKGKRWIWK